MDTLTAEKSKEEVEEEKMEEQVNKELQAVFEVDDELDPRNFLRNLYANDNYQQLKESTEKEIVSQAKLEVENKHFLADMDSFMNDLQVWKKTREEKVTYPNADLAVVGAGYAVQAEEVEDDDANLE